MKYQNDYGPMKLVRVWGEETEAEHCYGDSMIREGLALQSKVVPNAATKKSMKENSNGQ